MKGSVFIVVLFCSSLLIAQEEIIYDNSLKPGQKLIQTTTVETRISSSSVFADTVSQDLIDLIQELEQSTSHLSPGGNVEKTWTKIRLTTGEALAENSTVPAQIEFLDFQVSPDTLERLSLKGLKVYFNESKDKQTTVDSLDISALDLGENAQWLKGYYFELVKNFFPSVNPIRKSLKIGDHFTQDVIMSNMMFPGPVTNRQTYTLKEIKNGKGVFEVEIRLELPEDVIKKADPLDPEFEDILYFAITKFDGRGKGTMIFDPGLKIIEQLDMETTTEMELLRFGGSTTTTINTNTKTSESTKPEDQLNTK